MGKRHDRRWLTILMLACVVGCAHAVEGGDGRFSVSFEGTVKGEGPPEGRAPVEAGPWRFVPGVRGRALLLGEREGVHFATKGILDKRQGSLLLWVQPHWRVSGPGVHFFLREVSTRPDAKNLFSLHTYPGWVEFEVGSEGRYRKTPVFWEPGEWHQLAVTWDHTRSVWLYVDGIRMSYNTSDAIHIEPRVSWPVEEHERFLLGNGANWPPGVVFGSGDTALDELRIFRRVLSPREILEAYCADGGGPEVSVPWSAFPAESPSEASLRVRDPCRGDPAPGWLDLRIVDGNGRQVHEARTGPVQAGPQAPVAVPWNLPPLPAGAYQLLTRWKEEPRTLRSAPLWVYEPWRPEVGRALPAGDRGRVTRISCARERSPEIFCADPGARVVPSPLGDYMEAGSEAYSRFAYRFEVDAPHTPHELRVTYPDDRERIFDIVVNGPRNPQVYDVSTGVFTGDACPLSHANQVHTIPFWPRERENAVVFMTWQDGKPAAASEIEVRPLPGGLAPLPIPALPEGMPERLVGLYFEDPRIPEAFGWEGRRPEGFDRAVGNLLDYMGHTGLNVLVYPTVAYGGPFYASETQAFRGSNRYGSHPRNFVEMLLVRCQERGVAFYALFNMAATINLVEGVHDAADAGVVGKGPRTVTGEGRVVDRWGEGMHSLFNPIHPSVQAEIRALVREHVRRFGASKAFRGVAFHLAAESMPWLGSLDQMYDDETVRRFQEETGVQIPVEDPDESRFAKRHRWLLEHAREAWVGWRCATMAAFYEDLVRCLREDGIARELVLSVFMPSGSGEIHARWARAHESVEEILREAGLDLERLGAIPGVRIQRFFHPADYRRMRCIKGEGDITARQSRDIFFDADALAPFQRVGHVGVNLFYVYFESRRGGEQAIPGYWWEPLRWRVSTVTAGNGAFMEYPAHAMAAFDTWMLTFGGFQIPTMGHEERIRPFVRAFRALPAIPFEGVEGVADPVVMRVAGQGKDLYISLVNRTAHPVEVRWSLVSNDPDRLTVRDLGADTVLRSRPVGGTHHLSLVLGPYALTSLRAGPGSPRLSGARQVLPRGLVEELTARYAALQKNLAASWRVDRRDPAFNRVLVDLDQAFHTDPLPVSRIEHLLERCEVQRVLR